MVSEATAPVGIEPLVQASEDVREVWFFGGRTKVRATSETTGGSIGLVEQICDPGVGSPYHMHQNEDEQFYVIEGQMRFVSGEQSWTAGPGGFAFLPRGGPHGFEVVGDSPARFLIMVTPAGFERFVNELSQDEPGPPDMPKVMQTVGQYGIEILGPLPA